VKRLVKLLFHCVSKNCKVISDRRLIINLPAFTFSVLSAELSRSFDRWLNGLSIDN
jgi:hypothetical protein